MFPTTPAEQHIAGKRGPCASGDGFYQIAIGRDTPGKGMGVAQKDVPVNAWTHVALAMDGHTGWNVYANGARVNTVLAPNWKTRNSAPFLIGGSGSCARFKGMIEAVAPGLTAVYAGTVSADDIDGTVVWTWSGFKQRRRQQAFVR